MQIIITLRKDVADAPEARAIYDLVKQKMADKPEITVTGHCSNHFDLEQE
ncbi:hypothetical protein ES705_36002 [subsurface metagenome]